jgi:hypothetical protein
MAALRQQRPQGELQETDVQAALTFSPCDNDRHLAAFSCRIGERQNGVGPKQLQEQQRRWLAARSAAAREAPGLFKTSTSLELLN